MVPPSPTLDFAVAAATLAVSVAWVRRTRPDSPDGRRQAATALALLAATGLLFVTLRRFGYVDWLLGRPWVFGPFHRAVPAIAAELLAVALLGAALARS